MSTSLCSLLSVSHNDYTHLIPSAELHKELLALVKIQTTSRLGLVVDMADKQCASLIRQ